MRCKIVYLGNNPPMIEDVCLIMSEIDPSEFINKIENADLAIVNTELKLKEEHIQLINKGIEDHKIPLLLYYDGDYNNELLDQLNHTGVLRAGDPSDVTIAIIRNKIKNNRKLQELLYDRDLFELFLKYNTSYVFFKDENARVIKLSHNYETMLGIPYQEAIGKNMMELFPSELAKKMVEDDLRIIRNNETVEVIEELKGRYYKTSKFPIRREGKPSLLAGYTIDISDLKETERLLMESKAHVEKLIVTDEMLKISNRRGFLMGLKNEIDRISRYGNKSTLIILDIDNFKGLNDTLGHFKADNFLVDLVNKVNSILRSNDIFGRLGGDEFGIVCVSSPIEKGMNIAKRILEVVNKNPVTLDGKEYTYSISIGLTEINQEHRELDSLLNHADLALYDAKREGRNCVRPLKL
ncbi:MAG: diguanylate cyclase [Clostridiales bacterium]|nr:diguanylate cyclase [Clostridiales bacterium]